MVETTNSQEGKIPVSKEEDEDLTIQIQIIKEEEEIIKFLTNIIKMAVLETEAEEIEEIEEEGEVVEIIPKTQQDKTNKINPRIFRSSFADFSK